MSKLYELTDEYLALWDSLNDPDADWDAAEAALKGIEAALDAKVENCAKAIRGMESEQESILAEIERLTKRQHALETKTQGLKNYVQAEMETAGRDKIRTDLFTIAIQRSPDRLIVHSEAEIPDVFFKHIPATTQLDKTAVKKALAGGTAVPGCELTHGFHLRIR